MKHFELMYRNTQSIKIYLTFTTYGKQSLNSPIFLILLAIDCKTLNMAGIVLASIPPAAFQELYLIKVVKSFIYGRDLTCFNPPKYFSITVLRLAFQLLVE